MNRILIVDDNEKNCLLLKDMLQMQMYSTAIATNGREAMEYMAKNSVSLVLLDLLMPVMDGHQVLAAMKADKELMHIPVIVISAVDDMASITSCIGIGAEDYLLKPFQPEMLNVRIKSSLTKAMMHDELHSSLQKLKASENSRDAIIGMIIHDLKNPLTAIRLNAEMIQECDGEKGIALNSAQKIVNSTDLMTDNINGILDVSKLNAGEFPVNLTKVSGITVFGEVLNYFKEQIVKSGVSITTEFENVDLIADQKLLSRMLQNIIGNAIKYAGRDSKILCSVETTADNITFTISDNGPGIAPQYREAIFDKYCQINTKNSKSGVGLGLAFCRLAAQAQNGKVYITDSPLGGASFVIELPTK